MTSRRMRSTLSLLLAILPLAPAGVYAQGRGGGRGAEPPKSPREAAPIDLTGYWAAVVTTDWRSRLTVPPKGDYLGIAPNAEGPKLAGACEPAQDEAPGA